MIFGNFCIWSFWFLEKTNNLNVRLYWALKKMSKDQKRLNWIYIVSHIALKPCKNIGDDNGPWLKPPNISAREPKKEILQKDWYSLLFLYLYSKRWCSSFNCLIHRWTYQLIKQELISNFELLKLWVSDNFNVAKRTDI